MINGKISVLLFAGIMAGIMTACSEKKKTDDIITKKVIVKKPSAPVSMQAYTQTADFRLGGQVMSCVINRTPDSGLPMVADETGQKFVDNTISLVINRSDGSVVLERKFTKKDFDSQLDSDYRATGILEGLVFDKVEDGRARFAASVSHPQTDEYIPLVVLVSQNGSIQIERDTQLDTSAGDDADGGAAEVDDEDGV